jgi:hypothetical protein
MLILVARWVSKGVLSMTQTQKLLIIILYRGQDYDNLETL